jgi:membrane fusion protein, multidrug efflux system
MIRRFIPVPLFLALIACGSKPEAPTTVEAKTGPPVQVRTAVVSQAEWPSVYDAVGTVRARTATQVSARIMGAAREVSVHLGDHVRQGQVLVVIDSGDLEARQRQADAAFAEAQSAELEAQNGIESAKVNLELAQSTYKRMKDLHDKTSISNQEFDEASARLSLAKSGVDMAMSRRKQVESKIAQAKEGQNAVKIQIEYATITAPFAGVVTEKTVEPGNMVTPGAPLLTIEREGAFRLEAAVEEGNLGKVHAGMRASVSLDSLDRTFDATVSEIVPSVDAASRAFIAKIDLPSIPNLRGGLFGRARFTTGSRTVVAVPSTALVERGQMQWVFIADGETARGRIVTLGQRNQDSIEVLSGLKPGEKIIAPASPELVDGARIEVRP